MDDLIEFIEELEDECVEREVDGIDAFAVDYDWGNYSGSTNWEGLIELEEYCDSIGLPFSMMIWPANSCSRDDDDEDFFTDVMDLGDDYFNTYGGDPDILDFTAWDYVPRQMTPESYELQKPINDYPFTWGFLRFYDEYISTDNGSGFTSTNNCWIRSTIPNQVEEYNYKIRLFSSNRSLFTQVFDVYVELSGKRQSVTQCLERTPMYGMGVLHLEFKFQKVSTSFISVGMVWHQLLLRF